MVTFKVRLSEGKVIRRRRGRPVSPLDTIYTVVTLVDYSIGEMKINMEAARGPLFVQK